MKPLAAEWVAKAEGDFATMERESRARTRPNFDAVCFHAQQCAEKYLKARLQEANQEPPRIHDLAALLDLVLPLEPMWEAFREGMAYLSHFATNARYPGESADRESASQARKRCRAFRKAARASLGVGQ